jgi:nucleotide-binding universal stress UspA family protein
MFSTIVVGLDGRPHDREALALARALADDGATIIAAGVAAVDETIRGGNGRRFDAELLEAIDAKVDRAIEPYDDLEGVVTTASSVGRGLRELALGARAELIVTGSSRRGTLGRIFAGDQVRDILRHAPCPVAVAPVGFQHTGGPLTRIGVGHDGSAEADGALRLAIGLKARDGATVDIVEVVEPYPLAPPTGEPIGTTLVADVHRARANLDRIVAETGLPGRIITGSAAHELARLGRSVDLIAVGLHHRGLLDRLLVGSTAHALLREQAAPVLVVPPDEAPAAARAA